MEEWFGARKEGQGQQLQITHLSPQQVLPHSSEVVRGQHTDGVGRGRDVRSDLLAVLGLVQW